MQERARTFFLDRLRVAATCAVVLLHTVTGIMDATDISGYPLERYVFLSVMDLVCWCVPVFLLISGYLFLNPAREFSFRDMVFKYCKRIVLTLFLFGVPFAWIELLLRERAIAPDMLWRGFVMVLRGESWSHLWYLYLILLLYLVTPFLKRLLAKMALWSVYAMLAVLLLGSSILPFVKKLFSLETLWTLPGDCIYVFYYICGYLFVRRGRRMREREVKTSRIENLKEPDAERKENEEESKKVYKRRRRLLTAGVILLATGMVISRASGSYLLQMAYNYPFTVALALLLFGLGFCGEHCAERPEPVEKVAAVAGQPERNARKLSRTVAWQKAGAICFAIYLVHPVFLNVYYKFLHISPLDFCIWVSLPIFFLITLVPATLVAWLLCKIPVLKKWVL